MNRQHRRSNIREKHLIRNDNNLQRVLFRRNIIHNIQHSYIWLHHFHHSYHFIVKMAVISINSLIIGFYTVTKDAVILIYLFFSHFYLIKKTAAKQNTRKQSNVTMWNIRKL